MCEWTIEASKSNQCIVDRFDCMALSHQKMRFLDWFHFGLFVFAYELSHMGTVLSTLCQALSLSHTHKNYAKQTIVITSNIMYFANVFVAYFWIVFCCWVPCLQRKFHRLYYCYCCCCSCYCSFCCWYIYFFMSFSRVAVAAFALVQCSVHSWREQEWNHSVCVCKLLMYVCVFFFYVT